MVYDARYLRYIHFINSSTANKSSSLLCDLCLFQRRETLLSNIQRKLTNSHSFFFHNIHSSYMSARDFFSELPMSQIDKIKMFSRQGKIKLHQRNPKATITTAFNLSFSFFLHFTHNMKHLQLCFGQSDFHLPEVGLIIPNRSRLLGLTSSNREWWGTDLRKPSPQATHSPAHHWYQKGSITLIPRPHTPGRKWTCNENTPHYQRLPLNSGERVGHSRLI